MTRISVYDLLDNRRINYVSKPVSAGFITIKGGDIGVCPYEVSFLSYPASVSSTGSTAFYKRAVSIMMGGYLMGLDSHRVVSHFYEGLISYPQGLSIGRQVGVAKVSRGWGVPMVNEISPSVPNIADKYEGLILWDAGGTPLALYQEINEQHK